MLIAVFALWLAGCASGPQFPYRQCLVSRVHGRELYETGSVIAERDSDDAKLFQYDDVHAGDNGFQWIKPGDATKALRPCQAASFASPSIFGHRPPDATDPVWRRD